MTTGLPYAIHSFLFHRVRHQVNGHGRIRFLTLIGVQETGDTI